jgi:hypothetical protein
MRRRALRGYGSPCRSTCVRSGAASTFRADMRDAALTLRMHFFIHFSLNRHSIPSCMLTLVATHSCASYTYARLRLLFFAHVPDRVLALVDMCPILTHLRAVLACTRFSNARGTLVRTWHSARARSHLRVALNSACELVPGSRRGGTAHITCQHA